LRAVTLAPPGASKKLIYTPSKFNLEITASGKFQTFAPGQFCRRVRGARFDLLRVCHSKSLLTARVPFLLGVQRTIS
jgi:hypothetical protein